MCTSPIVFIIIIIIIMTMALKKGEWVDDLEPSLTVSASSSWLPWALALALVLSLPQPRSFVGLPLPRLHHLTAFPFSTGVRVIFSSYF